MNVYLTLILFHYLSTAQWMNVQRIRLVIFLIYVYSMCWAMMPFFGWGGYDVEPFGISCTLAWTHIDQSMLLNLSLFTTA